MINRSQIESILKINGVPAESPDDQIRSVLLSARFTKDEVDTALMVLRKNEKTNETKIEGLHKVFRTNESLQPEEISKLLGIDVDVIDRVAVAKKESSIQFLFFVIMSLITIIVTVAGILFFMYTYQIGLFHTSSNIAYFNDIFI